MRRTSPNVGRTARSLGASGSKVDKIVFLLFHRHFLCSLLAILIIFILNKVNQLTPLSLESVWIFTIYFSWTHLFLQEWLAESGHATQLNGLVPPHSGKSWKIKETGNSLVTDLNNRKLRIHRLSQENHQIWTREINMMVPIQLWWSEWFSYDYIHVAAEKWNPSMMASIKIFFMAFIQEHLKQSSKHIRASVCFSYHDEHWNHTSCSRNCSQIGSNIYTFIARSRFRLNSNEFITRTGGKMENYHYGLTISIKEKTQLGYYRCQSPTNLRPSFAFADQKVWLEIERRLCNRNKDISWRRFGILCLMNVVRNVT